MKIALSQLNYHIGNFEGNIARVKESIKRARNCGADLIVFAELALSGYPPRDFLEFKDFVERCEKAVLEVAGECVDIACIIGSPSVNPVVEGKDLYNSAYFLAEGRIQSVHHKTLLPNYDIFDEYRYFEPNRNFELAEYKGKKMAVTICEDLWNINQNPMYILNPMDELTGYNPDFIINIAASPFNYDQAEIRKEVLLKNVEKYKLPLFYVNHVGAQTELLFDGGSMAIGADGHIIDELQYFQEDFSIIELDKERVKGNRNNSPNKISKISLINDALVMGVKNYFGKLGFKKAILGLSGGIDSAVTMAIAAEALGSENVYAVLLPSEYSSGHSIADARELAENLGSPYDIIPIKAGNQSVLDTLSPYFKDLPFGIAEENIQARLRGLILMALSNKFGYILLNTSNKSEAAVGYGTLYGDMNGGLSVLGDVYKTQVFELAHYINHNKEIIPLNTITKPPSAELRPDQKDSDSLPEYDVLDEILYQYIEKRKGPRELVSMGFDTNIVGRILKLVNTSEYKRYQTPPILRVSPKAFGMGRRMPIVAKYLS